MKYRNLFGNSTQWVLPNKQQKITQNIRGVHNKGQCYAYLFLHKVFPETLSNGMVQRETQFVSERLSQQRPQDVHVYRALILTSVSSVQTTSLGALQQVRARQADFLNDFLGGGCLGLHFESISSAQNI